MLKSSQTLKNLLNGLMPGIFSSLNPCRKNKEIIIPCYGDDSEHFLALKMIAMEGLSKKATNNELVKAFRAADKDDQEFWAHTLSHELKIASLCTSIALNNQDSNVFEIGPYFGFSSLYYSQLIKEKGIPPIKSISKLTVIEIVDVSEHARQIKAIIEGVNPLGEIKYVYGVEGIAYLEQFAKDNDIVFGSICVPDVCNGILKLSYSKKINFVISYSEEVDREIKEKHGVSLKNLIDPYHYDIYPFEDQEYNTHVPWEFKKFGVLALIRNSS